MQGNLLVHLHTYDSLYFIVTRPVPKGFERIYCLRLLLYPDERPWFSMGTLSTGKTVSIVCTGMLVPYVETV